MNKKHMHQSVNYGLSQEEAESLKKRADEISYRFGRGEIKSKDLSQIGRLLQVNESNFSQLSGKPWFSKAWVLVTGKRGKIIDESIANLGKVQVGTLKILDELLRSNFEVKEDVLDLFENIDVIQNDIHELKHFILGFDEKNKARYGKLRRELGRTRTSVRFSMIVMGVALLSFIIAFTLPALQSYQTELGLGIAGAAGLLLLARVSYSYWMDESDAPLKVKKSQSVSAEQLPKDEAFERTEAFLGIDREGSQVFDIDTEIDRIEDYFSLSDAEQCLLFSIQHFLVSVDVQGSPQKGRWLEKWTHSVQRSVEGRVVTDPDTLSRGLQELRYASVPRVKLETILLQAYLFEPYYPLAEDENSFTEEYDENTHREVVEEIADAVDLDFELIEAAQERYEDAYENIPPSTSFADFFLGAAATAVAAIVGAGSIFFAGKIIGGSLGLSGSEAMSSGLALFGGGIIAGNDTGISKGGVVLIGGGALIGGGSAIVMLSKDKSFILRELSELEAVTKTFLVQLPQPKHAVSSVIRHVEEDKKALKDKSKSSSGDEAKQASTSVEYCESFLQRLRDFRRTEL